MKLIKFWGQEVKGQGYSKTTYLGGIFSPMSGMHRHYINETYQNYSSPGPRDTGDIFKVMSSKVKGTENIFQNMHFPSGGISIAVSVLLLKMH